MPHTNLQLNEIHGCSAKSWEYATAFADSLGTLPASVTSLVRFLLQDVEQNPSIISPNSTFLLERLLKSPSFQAPYFHAISMFCPERLTAPTTPFTTRTFIESFSATEHAIFTGMIFLHRQASRFTDHALFETATSWLQRGLNLGWLIGRALEPVGPAHGLLVGSYKWLGVLPFIRHDPEGFKAYTQHLATKDFASTDSEFELSHWECNSSQIGILLLQRMGFGSSRLSPLMRATMALATAPSTEPGELGFRAVDMWVKYLLEASTLPSVPLPAAYYLSPQNLNGIMSRLTDPGAKTHRGWLSATKHSISIEETPQLFAAIHNARESSDEVHPGNDHQEPPPAAAPAAPPEPLEDIDSIVESNFGE